MANALNTGDQGPVKLYACADIDEKKLQGAYKALKKRFGDAIDVPPERMFVGFDAYKKAIDVLRPRIDVAMCTTRPYVRPRQVEYAVGRGV